jgi:hypothetical protein
MKMYMKRLQAPSSNQDQDFTVSGAGTIQAAIIICGVGGSQADADGMYSSIGFWDGPTNDNVVSWGAHYEHADAAPVGRNHAVDTRVVYMIESGTGVIRDATIAGITNGIRLTWTGSDTTMQPYVIAIMFTGINGAQCGTSTLSETDSGSVTVTTTGVTPKLIFGGMNRANVNENAAWSNTGFGWAIDNGTGYDQMQTAWNALSTTLVNNYMAQNITDHDFIAAEMSNNNVIDSCCRITDMANGSFDHTTIYVDAIAGASSSDLYYLAIDTDAELDVFSGETPIASGDWTPYSGGGITPGSCLMVTSHMTLANILNVGANGGNYGIYAKTDAHASDNEFAHSWVIEDGANPTNTSGRADTRMIIQNELAGTPDFIASAPQFGSGEIKFLDANITEDTNGYNFIGLVIEAEATGATINRVLTENTVVTDPVAGYQLTQERPANSNVELLTDAAFLYYAFARLVVEYLPLTDQYIVEQNLRRDLSESATLTDAIEVLHEYFRRVSDAIAVGDGFTKSITIGEVGTTYSKVRTDALSVQDNLDAVFLGIYDKQFADTIALGEAEFLSRFRGRSLPEQIAMDTVRMKDLLTARRTRINNLTTLDTMSISDSFERDLQYIKRKRITDVFDVLDSKSFETGTTLKPPVPIEHGIQER